MNYPTAIVIAAAMIAGAVVSTNPSQGAFGSSDVVVVTAGNAVLSWHAVGAGPEQGGGG